MPIQFTCPHCGFQTNVAERFGGQTGSCASCRKAIAIPGKPVHTPKTGSTLKFTGLVAALGALGIVAIGGALFFLIFQAADTRPVPVAVVANTTGTAVASPKTLGRCSDNVAKIGEAFEAYHEQKGHYPPAYTTDESGNPLHSWRVLILPHLDEHELYARFDLTKPWNDPMNIFLAREMPRVFQCPGEPSKTDETSYMMIVGEEFLFHKDRKATKDDLKDGAASTLLVVEVKQSVAQWVEPVDLNEQNIDWNRNGRFGIGSEHSADGFYALTADGKVHHIGDSVSPDALKGMATREGGETIDPASWSN